MNKVKNTKEEKLMMFDLFDFIGMSTWEKDWLKTAQAKFYDPYPTVNMRFTFSTDTIIITRLYCLWKSCSWTVATVACCGKNWR